MSSAWKYLRGRRHLGLFLMSLWLIGKGLAELIALQFKFMDAIFGLLAIAAGVLILLDR